MPCKKKGKKTKKWGKIGKPNSRQRKEFLAKIRKGAKKTYRTAKKVRKEIKDWAI